MPDLTFRRAFARGPAGRTITLGCTYAASVTEVWSAVTEPERLARWFGAVLESLPDSRSVVLDVGGLPALVQIDRCAPRAGVGGEGGAVEANDPRGDDDSPDGSARLDMRWTWQGEPATRVVLRLTADGPDATAAVLEHSGLLVDSHVVGFGSGWEWSLTALAGELVGAQLDEAGLPGQQEVAHEVWRKVYESAG